MKYELTMSTDYVQDWGLLEAVRELLQNAIDSDAEFEWDFFGTSLHIHSEGVQLEARTLLLGVSDKQDDSDSIGKFGEGYKLAMLVLARMGYDLVIYNGDVTWKPELEMSSLYGVEQLVVHSSSGSNNGLTFSIGGLSPGDIAEIKESNLHMSPYDGEIRETSRGEILVEGEGKIYVNGLYVCDHDKLNHSYNIKPEYLELERDRSLVSTWDIEYETSIMWSEVDDTDRQVQMISDGERDMVASSATIEEEVKDECTRVFHERHPGAMIVEYPSQRDQLLQQGCDNVVVASSSLQYNVITSSELYKSKCKQVKVKQPPELMQDFYDKYRGYMRRPALIEFKRLIKVSEKWRR